MITLVLRTLHTLTHYLIIRCATLFSSSATRERLSDELVLVQSTWAASIAADHSLDLVDYTAPRGRMLVRLDAFEMCDEKSQLPRHDDWPRQDFLWIR